MTIEFSPKGVCSQQMRVRIEGGLIMEVQSLGGCGGNLQGLSRLIAGMPIEEAADRLAGIKCGSKSTSCPDQLSRVLRKVMEAEQRLLDEDLEREEQLERERAGPDEPEEDEQTAQSAEQ
jgi:uncharacterized protein (TIGR03905 family)